MVRRSVFLCVFVSLLALPFVCAAQSYGDGLGLGGVLLPDDGSLIILGTSRLGQSLGVELGVGLDLYDNDNTSSTNVGVALGLRKFWNTESAFQPFFGGRLSLAHSSWDYGQTEGDDTTVGLSALLGGEYFVTRHVSIEGEVGAGIYFGSFRLATGTRLAAFMYL